MVLFVLQHFICFYQQKTAGIKTSLCTFSTCRGEPLHQLGSGLAGRNGLPIRPAKPDPISPYLGISGRKNQKTLIFVIFLTTGSTPSTDIPEIDMVYI